MRPGGGKSKGSSFEREVSRLWDKLWLVVSGTFWRTTNSGGWKEPGDIAPRLRPANKELIWWPFVVECKYERAIDILEVFTDKKKKKLLGYWKQVTREQVQVLKTGKTIEDAIRLVIFKRNNSPIFVMFCAEEMRKYLYIIDKGILDIPVLLLFLPEVGTLMVLRWEDFAKIYTKEKIYQSRKK